MDDLPNDVPRKERLGRYTVGVFWFLVGMPIGWALYSVLFRPGWTTYDPSTLAIIVLMVVLFGPVFAYTDWSFIREYARIPRRIRLGPDRLTAWFGKRDGSSAGFVEVPRTAVHVPPAGPPRPRLLQPTKVALTVQLQGVQGLSGPTAPGWLDYLLVTPEIAEQARSWAQGSRSPLPGGAPKEETPLHYTADPRHKRRLTPKSPFPNRPGTVGEVLLPTVPWIVATIAVGAALGYAIWVPHPLSLTLPCTTASLGMEPVDHGFAAATLVTLHWAESRTAPNVSVSWQLISQGSYSGYGVNSESGHAGNISFETPQGPKGSPHPEYAFWCTSTSTGNPASLLLNGTYSG